MRDSKKQTIAKRMVAGLMVMMLSLVIVLPTQAAPASSAATYAAVFDSAFYAAKYADLQAVFGNNEAALLNHFITCGMAEGRQGNAEFNVQYYKARYADLQAAFGDNLPAYYMHYIACGKAEGRQGNGESAAPAPAAPGASTPAPGVSGPAAAGATAQETEFAYRVLAIMNEIRASYGLSQLSTTPQLMNVGQIRAEECEAYFSHTRPDGRSCFTTYAECGADYRSAGENIAAGQRSPEAVMNAWMNSPGHRANILEPGYNHVGIGCNIGGGAYGIYWSQNFTN